MPEPHPTTTPATIIAVDTETTDLRRPFLRNGRRIWDLGLIRREPDGTEQRLQAYVRIADLGLLEQIPTRAALDNRTPLGDRLRRHLPDSVIAALDVGRFWDRHPEVAVDDPFAPPAVVSEHQLAELLMSGWLLPGADGGKPYLMGVVPGFDESGLFDLLYRHKWITDATPYHYQPVDIEACAAGMLRQQPPWSSEDVSRAVGIDPASYARHTALGDAQWALNLYDAVFTPPPEETDEPHRDRPADDPPGGPAEDPDATATDLQPAGEDR